MRRLSDRDHIYDLAEKLAESGPGDRISAWVYGVLVAVLPAAYGLWCLASQTAIFLGTRPIRIVVYSGADAVALGIMYLSVGLFLHAHCFWSAHPRYAGVGDIGKLVSLAGIVGSVGYLIYSVMMLQ